MIKLEKIKSTPIPTLKRLTRYLSVIHQLKESKTDYISSTEIANIMGLDPIQVRKDLEFTGISGFPRLGFKIDDLHFAIKEILNWNNAEDAFLVGAGSLGQAILGYDRFKSCGLKIIAGFDINPELIGKKISNIEVCHINKIPNLIKRLNVKIGIICVPASSAQEVVDLMVDNGILALWNFAPIHVNVPSDIIIENAQLSQSLGILTHKLAEKIKAY